MKALNDIQRTQIRKLVGMVRYLQTDLHEATVQTRNVVELRNEVDDRLRRAQSDLAEMKKDSIARIGGSNSISGEIEKAEMHIRRLEQEHQAYADEVRSSMAMQEQCSTDLSSVRPVADRLVTLLDMQNPIRKMFDYAENPAFEIRSRA